MAADIAAILKPPYMRLLSSSILGVTDSNGITHFVSQIAREQFGFKQPSIENFELSVGAVFWITDDSSGMKILLKVLSPDISFEDARARVDYQRYIHKAGFPCPEPLSNPLLTDGLVLIDEDFVDLGRPASGHVAEDRALMASCLASLVELGTSYPSTSFPSETLITQPEDLWPKPHNALFDFSRRTEFTEWIDGIATENKISNEANHSPLVIGHLDWAAKHCRISANSISVVYDWDSTALVAESRVLGNALRSFTYRDDDGLSQVPNLDQMRDFLACYESARSTQFKSEEIDEIVSHLLYGAAYGARCEDSIDDGSESARTGNREFLKLVSNLDLAKMLRAR